MVKDAKRLKIALTKLNDWVVKHYGKDSRFTKVDLQGDLFSGFNTDPQCAINWNSAAQVIPLFKAIGINTSTIDSKTKKLKDSVDAKLLEPQAKDFEILPIYLDYKEAQKYVLLMDKTG